MTSDVGGQMDCDFVGTAIYISTLVGPSGGIFTATIDGNSVDVNTFRSSVVEECAITWSQWGLANQKHVVRVVFRGSLTANTTSDIRTSFGITRFTYVIFFYLLLPLSTEVLSVHYPFPVSPPILHLRLLVEVDLSVCPRRWAKLYYFR